MKLEIVCHNCGQSLLVDESSLQDEGEVPCVHCGAMIRVPAPARAGGSLPEPAVATPGAGKGSHPREVVCPRCGLHFQPRRGRDEAHADARRTVLVVEDQEYFLEIARDSLGEHYGVRTATTAEEALAALRGGGIDAMVLDLTLGGSEAGMRILEAIQPKPCPILIFTAEDEADMYGETWERLKSLGADDLVRKGMNVGESLTRKVAALLGDTWDRDD